MLSRKPFVLNPPVQTFFRTTTRSTEIDGFQIGEGEKILMFLGAANRDPRKWDRPESHDITRRSIGHVGFGSGIHVCSGQQLARLEGEVMLAELAKKAASLNIVGPVKRRYNNTLRGLDSLPIELSWSQCLDPAHTCRYDIGIDLRDWRRGTASTESARGWENRGSSCRECGGRQEARGLDVIAIFGRRRSMLAGATYRRLAVGF